MFIKRARKAVALLLCFSIVLCTSYIGPQAQAAAKSYSIPEIDQVITGIINWKKRDNGSAVNEPLINSRFLEQAGTTPGDWFPIGLGRYGYSDDYQGYLSVIADKVSRRYREPEKLSESKATEWHRISLAILAMGGDPTKIGKDANGKPINLIADGTYNRGKTASLGKQGINGWIWGLITLDSMRYAVPAGASDTREDIITQILCRQLPDGGFALMGEKSDPDISAMALQALAPYYNSSQQYTYQLEDSGAAVTKTVKSVVNQTLAVLSNMQESDGGYASWGTKNPESACQVLVALCSLGINPETDSRFIKNGESVIDGIMKFRMRDGGFTHAFVADSDNPSSVPNQSNSMASEQTLYSFIALYRYKNHMRTLYDFRPEAGKGKIQSGTVSSKGAKTPQKPDGNAQNPVSKPAVAEKTTPLLYFSDSDKKAVDSLPDPLSTEQYTLVVKLMDKLSQSEGFEGKDKYAEKLKKAKTEIDGVQKEIDALNQDIIHKLYPFDKITLKDKDAVNDIVDRYNRLSAYDQSKILHYDDVVKSKTQVGNLERALILSVVIGMTALGVIALIVYRFRKRRKAKKAAQMIPEESDLEEDEG